MTEHTLPIAVNCSIMFTEFPLLQRASAAKSVGYDAVEFWWPFPTATPSERDIDEFIKSIESAGANLIGLNFAAGDMPSGDRGLVSWPGREAEFRNSVTVAIRIAERLGTKAFNALYGNRIHGIDPSVQDDLAVVNLAWAAREVAAIGAIVLLEPVSGALHYPLRTAADVISVITRMHEQGVDNIKLLADLYHLSVNGDDVPAAIKNYGTQIGHVQVADAPGRHEPGTGELDLLGYLSAIVATGYRGYAALEYAPTTTTSSGLGTFDLSVAID